MRGRRGLQLGDAQGRRHGAADRHAPASSFRSRSRRCTSAESVRLSGLSREEGWSIYAASKTRWIAGDLDHTHEGGESYNDVRRRVVPDLARTGGASRGRDDHRRRPRRRHPRRPHEPAGGLRSLRVRPIRDRFRLGQRPVVRRQDLDGPEAESGRRAFSGRPVA